MLNNSTFQPNTSPRGLQNNELCQMNITHISIGNLGFAHIVIDI